MTTASPCVQPRRVMAWLSTLFAVLALTLAGCDNAGPSSASAGNVTSPRDSSEAARGPATPSFVRIASEQPGGVRHVTTNSLVEGLTESLGHGFESTEVSLRNFGFGSIIDEIRSVDGVQVHDIEAEAMIREIAQRAEAAQAGQGERVLASMYQSAAEQFPAVAEDDAFQALRDLARNTPSDQLKASSFSFASVPSPTQTFSPAIERAIGELGYVYADGHASELSHIADLAARKPKATFSKHLARHASAEDALRSFIAEHSPPPSKHELVNTIMRESTRYPAVAERSSFIQTISALDREAFGFDTTIDGSHPRYAQAADTLSSRVVQSRRAVSAGARGAISQAANAQNYVNYVATSIEASSAIGDGAARAGSGPSRSYRVARPTANYSARATAHGVRRGSRAFSKARFSASAGRGVSAGAAVRAPQGHSVVHAAWVANPDDDRFGRLFLEITDRTGRAQVVRTRTMFSDSVLAAIDVLWGGHSGRTGYESGDVLILMSMDPFAPLVSDELDAAYAPVHELDKAIDEYNALVTATNARRFTSQAAVDRAERDLARRSAAIDALEATLESPQVRARITQAERAEAERSQQGDRRIVLHPALHGRELAWSTTRVDFWLNDLAGAAQEAQRVSGLVLSDAMLFLAPRGFGTWQYIDRDSELRITDSGAGAVPTLGVRSSGATGAAHDRSHIALMLYDPPSSEIEREQRIARHAQERRRLGIQDENAVITLPDGSALNASGDITDAAASKRVQPLMNWLAQHHHDFMRLNDFYEAFAVLRWVNRSGVTPLVVDFDGPPDAIATPRRVNLQSGPFVSEYQE